MTAVLLAATTDSPAKIVFALLIAAGVLGLGLALVLMSGDSRGKIERRLGDLMQEPRPAGEEDDDENFVPKGDQALAETALMQRMVGITGQLAERAGLLTRTEDALEQADLPLRPPEALFFYFAGLFVVGMLGLLVLPIPMALILAVLAGAVPVIMLHRRRKGRLRAFQEQLPGTLNQWTATTEWTEIWFPQRNLRGWMATKLLDIADQLNATLKSNGADQNVATLAVTPAPAGG